MTVTVFLVFFSGYAGMQYLPMADMEACAKALKTMVETDFRGTDNNPTYCVNSSTGEIVGRSQ